MTGNNNNNNDNNNNNNNNTYYLKTPLWALEDTVQLINKTIRNKTGKRQCRTDRTD